jgi:hypothetical protein
MGMTFVAVADGRPDLAARAARELATQAWQVRADLHDEAPPAAEALRLAAAAESGPSRLRTALGRT